MFKNDCAKKLMNSWESLAWCDRVLEIIKVGRREKEDSEVAAIIDELQLGNYCERLLALYSGYGSYDGKKVLKGIKDPSRSVRNKAIGLITLVGSDAEILEALDILNFKQRRQLLAGLRNKNRLRVIDSCLTTLIAKENTEVERLLVYGTTEIVNRYLDRFLERASINEWNYLARLHPEIALNALQKYGATITEKDWRFVSYFNAVIPRLSELYSDRILDLIQNLVSHPSFSNLDWEEIIYYRPVEVATIILNSFPNVKVNLNPIAHKLPEDILINLIKKQPQTVNRYSDWLTKLKPQQRAAVYQYCHQGWRDKDGCLALDLLKLFSAAIREKEARYHLELPILQTRPTQRIPYAALLPWDETREIIQPYLKNPDAELRILALKTIIDATRYERTRLPELLKIIRDRSNEQDPVRNAMLGGLANLPPSIWKPEHLEDLGEILTDALTAADLSATTASYAQQIVIAILPFHPQWSAEWLSQLVQTRGRVNFYHLENRLNNSQIQQLAPVLLPVFKSWETREREWNIIEAAASFGKRLEVFDGLVDILERVLKDTRDKWNAARILNILSQYRRDRIVLSIPQLLQHDKSWFTQPVVSNYLHNFRQDLLTPFLGQTAYQGKFSTGKTRFVPFFTRGFSRWTFTQQTVYAQSLDGLTRDGKRDTPAVWSAIKQLSLLPAIEPKRLIQLASIENPQEAIRDRALRALSRLDSGQGVPVLLLALDDARARIAIYALRTCLLEMPVDNAVAILKNTSGEKITVAKEIIRLLGDLASDTAYQELLAWNERDLHRDVKIALLRALWEHLEKESTWAILAQAATHPDEAIATMVGRIPYGDRLSMTAQTKLISLLVTLLNRPEPTLRLTILQRCYQLPVKDTQRALLPQLLKSFHSTYPDEVAAAANAIFTTYTDTELIAATIQNIIPNRRNLTIAIASLQNKISGYSQELSPIVRAILSVLAINPITVIERIKLAVAVFSWDELTQFLIDLNNKEELHAEALLLATHTLNSISRHRQQDIADIINLETTLAASEDEKLRRLALAALIAQTNSHLGWNRERVDRLLKYRQDKSLLVAAAAQFTFPPALM